MLRAARPPRTAPPQGRRVRYRPAHASAAGPGRAAALGALAGLAVLALGVGGAGAHRAPVPLPGAVPPAAAAVPALTSAGTGDAAIAAPARTTAPIGRGAVGGTPGSVPYSGLAADGIPATALDAYRRAAARAARFAPGCGLRWTLLAGIGRVESDHARFGGAQLRVDGSTTRPIIGIPLNGVGTALIRDTDRGLLDGDRVYDRAVGPMQFIPSTWATYGMDGNGDGRADPGNIYDAALTAARYLCSAGGDLRTPAGRTRAVLAYNHSTEYLGLVLGLDAVYARGGGAVVLPVGPAPRALPALPPADPGRPRGIRSTRGAPDPAGSTSNAPTTAAPGPSSGTPSSPDSSPPRDAPSGPPSGAPSTPACTDPPGSSGPSAPATTAPPTTSSTSPAAAPSSAPATTPAAPSSPTTSATASPATTAAAATTSSAPASTPRSTPGATTTTACPGVPTSGAPSAG